MNDRLNKNIIDLENKLKTKINVATRNSPIRELSYKKESPPHKLENDDESFDRSNIQDYANEEMKSLLKGIPPINEWPKFRGEGAGPERESTSISFFGNRCHSDLGIHFLVHSLGRFDGCLCSFSWIARS